MSICSSEAVVISNRWHYPEGMAEQRILPLPLSMLASVVSGVVKTIMFPITTFFFMLAFTIKAIYECANDRNGGKYATAALLNFAGLVATATFLGAAAFYLPFPLTCGIFLTAVSVSVIYHLVKAIRG